MTTSHALGCGVMAEQVIRWLVVEGNSSATVNVLPVAVPNGAVRHL
ncbi:hypothetical protein [Jonesia quinghaiensis]|nr:hypothetical protein [Jonesia quinghaiensis]